MDLLVSNVPLVSCPPRTQHLLILAFQLTFQESFGRIFDVQELPVMSPVRLHVHQYTICTVNTLQRLNSVFLHNYIWMHIKYSSLQNLFTYLVLFIDLLKFKSGSFSAFSLWTRRSRFFVMVVIALRLHRVWFVLIKY